MKTEVNINNVVTDFEVLHSKELNEIVGLEVYSDADLLVFSSIRNKKLDENAHIIGIDIILSSNSNGEYKTVMGNLSIVEAEFLARSILSQVETIRNNYGHLIQKQIDMGVNP
jgi:hypothetical protein